MGSRENQNKKIQRSDLRLGTFFLRENDRVEIFNYNFIDFRGRTRMNDTLLSTQVLDTMLKSHFVSVCRSFFFIYSFGSSNTADRMKTVRSVWCASCAVVYVLSGCRSHGACKKLKYHSGGRYNILIRAMYTKRRRCPELWLQLNRKRFIWTITF